MIAVIDFGSQYTQLIARRVRECRVYSEIFSCFVKPHLFDSKNLEGIILSGGPGSVFHAPTHLFKHFFKRGVPVLGICYGMQLAAQIFCGKVQHGEKREYGPAEIITRTSPLFDGLPKSFKVWMSHGDSVVKLPKNARVIGFTEAAPIAAFQFHNFYGLQFHPEVRHTQYGLRIINSFLTKICRVKKLWSMRKFIDEQVVHIKSIVKDDNQWRC
jgi:GMP synthase (glutamine-hydrolysing)